MENTLILLAGLLIAFLVGLFTSGKQKRSEGKVLDLTQKIKTNQAAATQAQADADNKVKEYQDALKAYDPNFHSDDDNGKPSA